MSSFNLLRGAQLSSVSHNTFNVRILETTSYEESQPIILSQTLSFQIIMSIFLGFVILLQLALMISFFLHRSKRVLEFAQPTLINICNYAAISITSACYLFLFTSNLGCAVREPIIFIGLTIMGATIAGRAWRISTLFSPMMSFGRSSTIGLTERQSVIEKSRLSILNFFKGATGRRSAFAGNRLRIKISICRSVRAISLMVLPQILLQTVLLALPTTRSKLQTVYLYQDAEVLIAREQCQSEVNQEWYLTFSILFVCIPFCLAWLFNIRPKNELEKLPEMVDERILLKKSFWVFIKTLISCAPLIGMTMTPNAYIYATICTVLSPPLSICYFISYSKLASIDRNTTLKRDLRTGTDGRNSVSYAVRMAEMYVKIGRVQEAVQLVEETLNLWRKGVGGQNTMGFGARAENEEIGSGFTKNDLAALEPEELELIIQLLKIKGKTLITLHGHQTGSAMFAKLHVDILKIYENCPASTKLKDSSIIFPVYNYLGIQIRGGAFEQDDTCSLEVALAERFYCEAQSQSYHLARALANLADVYGRTGHCDEAFKYYDIMQSIYTKEHCARLNDTYAVDRCAVCIATSALWYLQVGQIDAAIERCDYVAEHVLPSFDDNDTIGKYHTILAIIRVLKWNSLVDRARELYERHIPDGTENHFAVGSVHKPMSLLLKICEGSSVKHSVTDADIALALDFEINDFSDNIWMSDGWSLNSLGAEVCLHLARRLKPGETIREKLIKKGILLSSIADTRVKAANGMVKHILAYKAHRDVHLDLLALAGLDAKTSRTTIYEIGKETWRSISSRRNNTIGNDDSITKSMRQLPGTECDIVNRLVLKEEASRSGSDVVVGSSGSAQSRGASFEKEKKTKISQRLSMRDVSSSSAKLSCSSYSVDSVDPQTSKSVQYLSQASIPEETVVKTDNLDNTTNSS